VITLIAINFILFDIPTIKNSYLNRKVLDESFILFIYRKCKCREYKCQSRHESKRGYCYSILCYLILWVINKLFSYANEKDVSDISVSRIPTKCQINRLFTNETMHGRNNLQSHVRLLTTISRMPRLRTKLHHYFETMNSYNV